MSRFRASVQDFTRSEFQEYDAEHQLKQTPFRAKVWPGLIELG